MTKYAIAALAASAALALTGCAAAGTASPMTTGAPTVATSTPPTAAAPTLSHSPAQTPTATPWPSPAVTFPSGQPPRPGAQDNYPKSDTVPGLTAAIAAASHPGLQICSGSLASLVTAKGDLRGDGGLQYLVDTTCAGATATSPDEVSLYDEHAGTVRRSAVIYETTVNRPATTAYPYIWHDHTVVLTYDGGTKYRLVELTPSAVVPGLVESFR